MGENRQPLKIPAPITKTDPVRLQLRRLRRHLVENLKAYDEVALINLANALRAVFQMRAELVARARSSGVNVHLKDRPLPKALKKVFGKSPYLFIALSEGVSINGATVAELIYLPGRVPTAEERAVIQKVVKPHAHSRRIGFNEWAGAAIIHVRLRAGEQAFQISREMIAKRVANVLGGSHPEGQPQPRVTRENMFDEPLLEISGMVMQDRPVLYTVLIKIAHDIVEAFHWLEKPPSSTSPLR